ncbi:MAG: hypothetical protein OXI16_07075 [Chloroflexota bacterium]|nr:hypothetical protein [Chloroflexota bacterium]MDE2687242.1 hypothetical protein [Chloroflexota bacterium]MYC08295.1 hypothetical protein [Chloroflexota bacterium]
MKILEALYALRYPLLWAAFIGFGVLLVLVASGVQVPGIERQIAVSQETRDAAATANAPTIPRAEAIERVREYLRNECANGAAYLEGDPGFTAVFLSNPRTDDHHERGDREWQVTHTPTDDFWRLYEGTGEIITVKGDC